jgi:hypothetical protein
MSSVSEALLAFHGTRKFMPCIQEPATFGYPEPQLLRGLVKRFVNCYVFTVRSCHHSVGGPPLVGFRDCSLLYSKLPSIPGGLLLHPWIISLIVCFGFVPKAGKFLRIYLFRCLFNNISSKVWFGR